MYISKKLEWIGQYVVAAKKLYPNIRRLKSIRLRNPQLKKLQTCNGQITWNEKTKDYKISVCTVYIDYIQRKPLKEELAPYSTIDILTFIAHELSHIYHWEHTTHHKQMEAQLLAMFMNTLQLKGYKSEEIELGDRRSITSKECRKIV